MFDTKKLTQWAIDTIKTQYPEDVELLIGIDKHTYKGDGHGECFDYYIPATERGYELGQDFIIEGIGHDLYPRSWKRIEDMANLDDWFVNGLAQGNILYAKSEQDRVRFEAMQVILAHNLNNREFTYRKALKMLDEAMNLYRTLCFEENLGDVRMAVRYVDWYLSMGIAYLNGTYFHEMFEPKRSEEMKAFELLPDKYLDLRSAIYFASSVAQLQQIAHDLIATTRVLLAANTPSSRPEAGDMSGSDLADWYAEMSLTLRRLHGFCQDGDYENAFVEGCSFQKEVAYIMSSLGGTKFDILGAYDPNDLAAYDAAAHAAEQEIIRRIEALGGKIRQYDSIDSFLKDN